jgi:glycosyltransferase involved in cell wall biosynthesis
MMGTAGSRDASRALQIDGTLLIVSYEEISSHNGLNTRIRGIVRALSAAGRHVEIAAPSYGSKPLHIPTDLQNIRIHTIRAPDLVSRWRIPMVARALSVAVLTVCIVRHLRRSPNRFAWVQSEQIYPFLASYVLARRWQAGLILDDPSLLGLFVEEKLRNRRILRPLLRTGVEAFETALWKRADCILCSSRRTAGRIVKRIHGAKTRVCRLGNGVDLQEFTAGPGNSAGNRIFFNCSVPYYQNVAALQNLLRIFEQFEIESFHNYSAVIAVNDAAALPPRMATAIRSNPRVHLLSNQKSLAPSLRDCDMVLLPYARGHLTTAGPRLKVFEALACGKIVLSTREGLDEVQGCVDGRNVILCSDWLDMAHKTMGLIAEGETPRKQTIRREARRFAEREYSWPSLVKAYEPILGLAAAATGS